MTPAAVGVLGGTFDPIHLGHLHVATGVGHRLGLARVLLVPCARPAHKVRPELAPAADRMAMLRLAVAGSPGLEVSSIEIDRGGTSYTIDTLRALRDGVGILPVFVTGMDAWLEVETWKDSASLVAEFDFAVVDRPGAPLGRAGRLLEIPFAGSIPDLGRGGRAFRVPLPLLEVSSSRVRSLAAAGASLGGLVPPDVARYIQHRSLYRRETER